MTYEEAIKRAEIELICMECPTDKACYNSNLQSICEHNDIRENVSLCEALKVILSALKDRLKGEWTPVSSVEEMPKETLWVTHKGTDYAYVELIGWDSQRNCRTEDGGFRCDISRLKDVVAYMPYSRPEPYKSESEEV